MGVAKSQVGRGRKDSGTPLNEMLFYGLYLTKHIPGL